MNELIANVEQWSKDKNLHQADSAKQFLKVTEEVGEVASALARGNHDGLKDGIGDVIVTLIILAQQNGLTVEECLSFAYDEIKDRKGKLLNGTFVKEADLKEKGAMLENPPFKFKTNEKMLVQDSGTIYEVRNFEGDSSLVRVIWGDGSAIYEKRDVMNFIEEGTWIKI